MSKERELLKKILATGWLNNTISCEVEDLLNEPEQEPFKPDWVNYRQGVEDAKREPLSYDQIVAIIQTNMSNGLFALARAVEEEHGIGL